MTLPRMALGIRIKRARTLKKISQKWLVEAVGQGLTQQALSNLENRDSDTSIFAIRIADKLGVSIRWLLDGAGSMDDTDWPFPRIDRDRWTALGPEDRADVQGAVNLVMLECERRKPGKATVLSTAHDGKIAPTLHERSKQTSGR